MGLHTSTSGFSGNFSVLYSNLTASGRAGLCGEKASNSCWLPVCFLQEAGVIFEQWKRGSECSVGLQLLVSPAVLPREVNALIFSAVEKLRGFGGVLSTWNEGSQGKMMLWKELGPLGCCLKTQRQFGFLELTLGAAGAFTDHIQAVMSVIKWKSTGLSFVINQFG